MIFICKLDRKLYSCISENIVSDEVIITEERVEHIMERHPADLNAIMPFLKLALEVPDYILHDSEHGNTGLILKLVEDNDIRFQIVLRVQTTTEQSAFKNSVISAWQISESRWNNYLRNKKVLYKRK